MSKLKEGFKWYVLLSMVHRYVNIKQEVILTFYMALGKLLMNYFVLFW